MSYIGDTFIDYKPSGSYGEPGILAYLAPDPPNPEAYINVRLSNGDGYYTAGGTTVSGGAVLMSDQGAPGLLSSAWPVKLSNGSAVIGVETAPLWVTGTVWATLLWNQVVASSGSTVGTLVGGQPMSLENPTPVQQVFRPTHVERYDISSASIYYGFADRGSVSSSPVWTIKRTSLDGSGNPTLIQWSVTSSWDSRTGLTYT